MLILYCYLCLTIVFLLPLWALRLTPATNGTRELISANNVFLLTYLVYVGISSAIFVSDGFVSYWAPIVSSPNDAVGAYSVSIWALLVYLAVYRLFVAKRAVVVTAPPSPLRTQVTMLAAGAMIIVGIAAKLYVVAALGGIEATAVRLSGSLAGALGYDEISPTLVVIRHFSAVADAGALWGWLTAMRLKRGRVLWTATLLLVMGLVYITTAKRLYMLLPAIAVAIGLSRFVRPIKLSSLPWALPLILLAGMASLIYRAVVPSLIYGQNIDMRAVGWANGSLLSFYFRSLEYTTFDMIAVAVSYTNEIANWFGGTLNAFYVSNIEPLWYIIPRVLWPDKPEQFSDISFAINWYVNRGGGTDPMDVGWASTVIGSFWVTGGGLLGLTIAMAGIAIVSASADTKGRHSADERGILWYAFMITLVFHLFRQGSIGWTFIIVVTQQLGLVLGLMVLWALSRASSKRPRAIRHLRRSMT